jgi:hypothetical protein
VIELVRQTLLNGTVTSDVDQLTNLVSLKEGRRADGTPLTLHATNTHTTRHDTTRHEMGKGEDEGGSQGRKRRQSREQGAESRAEHKDGADDESREDKGCCVVLTNFLWKRWRVCAL